MWWTVCWAEAGSRCAVFIFPLPNHFKALCQVAGNWLNTVLVLPSERSSKNLYHGQEATGGCSMLQSLPDRASTDRQLVVVSLTHLHMKDSPFLFTPPSLRVNWTSFSRNPFAFISSTAFTARPCGSRGKRAAFTDMSSLKAWFIQALKCKEDIPNLQYFFKTLCSGSQPLLKLDAAG